jgi:hypothetical protein
MSQFSESPWLNIWLWPRKTMQKVLFADLEKQQGWLALMSAVAGFSLALDLASMFNLGDQYAFATMLLACTLVGPLLGLLILYAGGWLFTWMGVILNGWGRPPEVRAAIAWSLSTAIWALLLWLPRLAIMGGDVFSDATPVIPLLATTLGWLAILRFLIALWGLALFLICLSEAHRFSIWYAYAAAFTGALIITVVVVVLSIVIPLFFR